ncbi:MerR family transcriptional regulator [Streptomyces candidus]|uniref:DNA-binding transcriptional MerR regulator n=1 Tax=Streptomyces candidus TaxID=67283 RepID=A0A7X0HA47_9ACTN|nr:MerR family transcriptional regulator [Streptomyces candidus]MBB6433915.1 DNA-binding transcriptional MerR regulator [Streptomyces candidus]GHH34050.1 MerR family transcriptional regulator [Streptomyces candidus]
MRIGEIAALVGVTTRAVRHYHHVGLLPEPERRTNGYRQYGLRDAVVLARIRRLTELGLGLEEVRDVLRDDAGRELAEVLGELDEDLARQEAEIRGRRERIGGLLEQARDGGLSPECPVSEELAELLRALPTGGDAAAKDREVLALIDTHVTDDVQAQLVRSLREAATVPGAEERAQEVYARLDALADAAADDPRVAEAARVLASCIPDGMWGDGAGAPDEDAPFVRAFYAHFAPAQAEVLRQAMRLAFGPDAAGEEGGGPT